MFKEFKDFAFKGNVIDMAVGIIIGGAFGTFVKSLVEHVFMPPLGLLVGSIDFSKLKLVLQKATPEQMKDGVKIAATPEVAIAYGQFLTDAISFVILAFVVFLVVKKAMALFHRKKEEAAAAPPAPGPQEVLLAEIRDLLKQKGS